MVHKNDALGRRDVYLMAISANQITKWDYSLGLQKKPTYIDPYLQKMRQDIFKQMDQRIRVSKSTRLQRKQELQMINETGS